MSLRVWSAVNRMGWHSPVWALPQDNEQVLHRGREVLEGKSAYCHLPGLIRCMTHLGNSDGGIVTRLLLNMQTLRWDGRRVGRKSPKVRFQVIMHFCNQKGGQGSSYPALVRCLICLILSPFILMMWLLGFICMMDTILPNILGLRLSPFGKTEIFELK